MVTKLGPETPLERLSVANYIGCTKNQPKRLRLKPFRDIRTFGYMIRLKLVHEPIDVRAMSGALAVRANFEVSHFSLLEPLGWAPKPVS